jgi:hypothetical protein
MGSTCSTHVNMRNSAECYLGNLKGIDRMGDPGVDGRIILKYILIF